MTAHLLVPGFTFTGLTRGRAAEKPPGAWTAGPGGRLLLAGIEAGDFYILCPDNDVTRAMDNKRMAWAMGDLIEKPPAAVALGIPTTPKPSPPSWRRRTEGRSQAAATLLSAGAASARRAMRISSPQSKAGMI